MKKAKCVMPIGTLVKDVIYTIIEELVVDSDPYVRIQETGTAFFAYRFEVIGLEEDQPTTNNKYANKECPCGLQSIDCEYHKQ